MIDAVYVFGSGSKQNDFELQCSIASLRRHVSNIRDIIIIGSAPRSDVGHQFEFMAMPDCGPSRSANTTNKLRKACTTGGISDKFMLMNDDFFFTRDVDAATLGHFRSGFLRDHIEHRSHCKNGYYNCLVATEKALKKNNLPTRDFEIHVPMIYDRMQLYHVIGKYDFTQKSTPLMRSIYCNTLGIEGERLTDLKFDSPVKVPEIETRLGDRWCFSIGDGAFMANSEMKSYLKGRYL